ncbi:flippase [Aeromonas rivipollensis]|uniref:flippase n=1 Tax=Aeromonas rivipollensis TaxID=948519 RepID=UPI000D125524|nr:flippase [Aeromonas rivipollensis]AVP93668.1 flippase [Aeromonas rivipollensis]
MVKNILYLLSVQGLSYLFPLITLPYLVQTLGVREYGVLGFSLALSQYGVMLVDFGFNYSATRDISLYRDDAKERCRIFWSVFYAKSILAVTACIVLYVVVNYYNHDFEKVNLYWSFLSIIGAALFPLYYFQGVEKMKFIAILSLLSKLLSLIMIFTLVKSSADTWVAIAIQSSINLIAALFSLPYLIIRGELFFYKFKINDLFLEMKKSSEFFLSSVSINLYTTSLTVILGIVSGPHSVGYFVAADKLRAAVQGLIGPVIQAVYPRVSRVMNKSTLEGVRLSLTVFKYQFSFMFIICIVSMFMADHIINILYGTLYKEISVTFRVLMIVPIVVTVSNIAAICIMIPIGMKKAFTKIVTISGVLSLPITFIMAWQFSYNGVAISLVFIEFIIMAQFIIALVRSNIFSTNVFRGI